VSDIASASNITAGTATAGSATSASAAFANSANAKPANPKLAAPTKTPSAGRTSSRAALRAVGRHCRPRSSHESVLRVHEPAPVLTIQPTERRDPNRKGAGAARPRERTCARNALESAHAGGILTPSLRAGPAAVMVREARQGPRAHGGEADVETRGATEAEESLGPPRTGAVVADAGPAPFVVNTARSVDVVRGIRADAKGATAYAQ
jgi:hypothetical protein